MLEGAQVSAQLAASQEGLSSMKLVSFNPFSAIARAKGYVVECQAF
jgi:hypothetical protein